MGTLLLYYYFIFLCARNFCPLFVKKLQGTSRIERGFSLRSGLNGLGSVAAEPETATANGQLAVARA